MTMKSMWIAGLAAPVMMAMLLLVADHQVSRRVTSPLRPAQQR